MNENIFMSVKKFDTLKLTDFKNGAILNEIRNSLIHMYYLLSLLSEKGGDEQLLRKLLWLSHGCIGLYGDDGEMQCGKCLIDFKRDSPQLIERKLMLRHGKFVQIEHGEVFIPNDFKEGKDG